MKYQGKELTKFKSDKNVAFNPSKEMIVWDDEESECCKTKVLAYTSGISFPVITLTGTPYRFCAEIPKITNWDVYQERYGATMKSLDEALEVFNAYRVVPCQFCPARGYCASDVRSKSCRETFKGWAETEAKDETAGNV